MQARTQACFQVARKPHQEVGVTFTVSASVEVLLRVHIRPVFVEQYICKEPSAKNGTEVSEL